VEDGGNRYGIFVEDYSPYVKIDLETLHWRFIYGNSGTEGRQA